eukprot:gene17122-20941_t
MPPRGGVSAGEKREDRAGKTHPAGSVVDGHRGAGRIFGGRDDLAGLWGASLGSYKPLNRPARQAAGIRSPRHRPVEGVHHGFLDHPPIL